MESELKKSRREAEKYKSLYEVLKTEKFSQTSQSSKYSGSGRSSGRDDEKDGWDGSHNDKETKVSEKEEVPSEENSLIFGSHKGVETSAVYHTFIATCRMRALSFCEFLKNTSPSF